MRDACAKMAGMSVTFHADPLSSICYDFENKTGRIYTHVTFTSFFILKIIEYRFCNFSFCQKLNQTSTEQQNTRISRFLPNTHLRSLQLPFSIHPPITPKSVVNPAVAVALSSIDSPSSDFTRVPRMIRYIFGQLYERLGST